MVQARGVVPVRWFNSSAGAMLARVAPVGYRVGPECRRRPRTREGAKWATVCNISNSIGNGCAIVRPWACHK